VKLEVVAMFCRNFSQSVVTRSAKYSEFQREFLLILRNEFMCVCVCVCILLLYLLPCNFVYLSQVELLKLHFFLT